MVEIEDCLCGLFLHTGARMSGKLNSIFLGMVSGFVSVHKHHNDNQNIKASLYCQPALNSQSPSASHKNSQQDAAGPQECSVGGGGQIFQVIKGCRSGNWLEKKISTVTI